MCGILAVVNFDKKNIDKAQLTRMRDTMYHRGPDDAGIYVNGSVGLAHRRLSIIDLSTAGQQPMSNEDGTIHIVFNGEIYNYVELREDLLKRGHRFHSTSDTEVIIHQYEEDGERCLDKFNGMFSFALWDSKSKRLFAARDRIGIKPLHYFIDDKRIILSSEIKAIIEDPQIPRIPDYQAMADYFYAGWALGNKTMFQDVRQIEPGQMITVDAITRRVQIKKYWDVIYNYNYSRTEEKLKEDLFSLLDDAVKIHCRSDASLGCHLSGGLDSSTIVAFAAKHRKSLKTFSIKFSDDDYIDETPYAKAVAAHVNADYHESSPSDIDLTRLLPKLIWHIDAPMTCGAFTYYTVSQLAQQYVKVSLTGHGGDELFAGYPAQFQASFNRTDMFDMPRDPDNVVKYSFMKKLINSLAAKGFKGTYKSVTRRFLREEKSLEDLWIDLHCGSLPERNLIFEVDCVNKFKGYSSKDVYVTPFREVNTDRTLDKCLYHDLRMYLPSLLDFEDRVSMAVSLESRVPLLDYRIVEFLATVPVEQKVKGMQPKYLLRQVASSLLPEQVWKRTQKFSFRMPGRMLHSPGMRELTKNILLSPESLSRGIFRPQVLKDAYADIGTASSIDGPTWLMVNMELWFKIFIDRDPYWVGKARG